MLNSWSASAWCHSVPGGTNGYRQSLLANKVMFMFCCRMGDIPRVLRAGSCRSIVLIAVYGMRVVGDCARLCDMNTVQRDVSTSLYGVTKLVAPCDSITRSLTTRALHSVHCASQLPALWSLESERRSYAVCVSSVTAAASAVSLSQRRADCGPICLRTQIRSSFCGLFIRKLPSRPFWIIPDSYISRNCFEINSVLNVSWIWHYASDFAKGGGWFIRSKNLHRRKRLGIAVKWKLTAYFAARGIISNFVFCRPHDELVATNIVYFDCAWRALILQ